MTERRDDQHRVEMRVTGMDCPSCARSVEAAIERVDGVARANVDFASGRLTAWGERGSGGDVRDRSGSDARDPIDREALAHAVRGAGFDVEEAGASAGRGHVPEGGGITGFLRWMASRTSTRLALIAIPLVLPGFLWGDLLGRPATWMHGTSLTAMVLAGYPVARAAWRSVTAARRIDINVLMTIAAIGAVIIGAYAEAGMLMVLFAIGEAMEGYTVGRARASLRSLEDVAPETATRLAAASGDSGSRRRETIPVSELTVGDVVLVRPGERIPADGRISAGASGIDQSAVTGESVPVARGPGDEVFAGTVNGERALEVRVERPAEQSTIQRIIHLVEEAQSRRSRSQRLIDRFAAWYTPAVLVVAVAVAVVPPLAFGAPFRSTPDQTGWLYRALALLVVACPCALVISTPVAVIAAIDRAAREGVLIKGGAALERLSEIRAVAFDKTGTLTEGQPELVRIQSQACELDVHDATVACDPCDELLALAGAVERRSEHPVARAVTAAASGGRHGLRILPDARNVTALAGRGVQGEVGGRRVTVASHRYFDEGVPHDEEHCRAAHADAEAGLTPMLVDAEGDYVGRISVSDTVRPSAAEAVRRLSERLGADAVALVTGDSEATAQRVAETVGIAPDRTYGERMPEEKLALLPQLRNEHGPVLMVGDGINDAPALADADVGVAMGGPTGTAQAMDTADVGLMTSDLRRLPWVLSLADATTATIRTNVAVAVGIKLAFMALVLTGIGTMWQAVLADVGASVVVTLYGMRLVRWNEG